MSEIIHNILIDIGLSSNEVKIYVALLELGGANVTQISIKSKVHRTNVYDSLQKLAEKGIVSQVMQENIKFFEATDPKNFITLLREKEMRLSSVLPQLSLLKNSVEERGDVVMYKGIKAFRNFLGSLLDFKETILMIGIPKNAVEIIGPWINLFHKERIRKKIEIKHLYNENAKERIRYLNSLDYTKARYLPKAFDSPSTTNICGDTISMVIWGKEIKIIIIRNRGIADAYKRYFDVLWRRAKRA